MSKTALTADKVLDCSGKLCPMPVIHVAQTIKEIEVGNVLKMIATDPGSPPDIAAWAGQTGHELLDSHKEANQFIFFIRRKH